MWNNLFSSVGSLEKGIGAAWLRNEVISNNIANIDTPGFKASRVEFEGLLSAAVGKGDGTLALTATHEGHITGAASGADQVEARVVTDGDTAGTLDENNVDIEHEMVELAKNSIEYYALVSKVNSEFRKLDAAINVN